MNSLDVDLSPATNVYEENCAQIFTTTCQDIKITMLGCFPKFFHPPSNNSPKSTSLPYNSPESTQQFSTLCKTCTKILDISALNVEKAGNKQDGKLKVWRCKCRYKTFISHLEFHSSNGCELCGLLLKFKLRDNGLVDGYWRNADWKKKTSRG